MDERAAEKRQLVGIGLAVGGNLIISIALNVTKYAHNLNQLRDEPKQYTHLPLWWLGFALTLVGETGNFAAYGFTEASLIAPLGAVSVLANAFIAAIWLGEGLRVRDLVGCLLCIAGGCVIIFSTPDSHSTMSIDDFIASVQSTPFVLYMVCLVSLVCVMLGFQDTYGHRHVAYFVLLCSLLGSVTVMACKGVSTFVNLWIAGVGEMPFSQPVLYLLLLVLASTAILQIRYLNEAMERFGNTETVPVYYVLFTLSTIVGSNILYKDFAREDRVTVGLFAVGCGFTFAGVKLLTSRRGRDDGVSIPYPPPEYDDYHSYEDKEGVRSSIGGVGSSREPTPRGRYMPPSRSGGPLDDFDPRIGVGGGRPGGELASPREFNQPLTLSTTPMGFSGDVLRRTFSSRPGDGSGRGSGFSTPRGTRGTL